MQHTENRKEMEISTAFAGTVGQYVRRVYTNMAIVEAQVRVIKTGKPEIVSSSGVGRTKAVLIQRTESGDDYSFKFHGVKLLLSVLLDVSDGLSYGGDCFSLFVRYRDIKLLFKFHNQLHLIQ